MKNSNLYIIAGLNGSGKSTVAKKYTDSGMMPKHQNPDDINKSLIKWTLNIFPKDWTNKIAVEMVEWRLKRAIKNNNTIAIETVLSSNKYLPYIQMARAKNYKITMIYVALSSVELNIARVKMRVEAGGHDVPEQKIRDRYQRSLNNLKLFIPFLDNLTVIDNSDDLNVVAMAFDHTKIPVIYDTTLLPEIQQILKDLLKNMFKGIYIISK
jgi:predicted ABC-type ATPase